MNYQNKDKSRLTIRLEEDLRNTLEKYAITHHINLNEAVTLAIRSLLESPDLTWKKDLKDLKEQIQNHGLKLSKIEKCILAAKKLKSVSFDSKL
ncbi:hypothetical protein C7H19_15325 [Aphanothece hegewaldii CCALA 016]|uniref:Uncharacterized protein n=1 Tax=Aphanothece hegewaldii CCALA 016 TaxID=2107694 RepID=A0A2T1LVP6_9CHRO|nr:hypothetical protein [Aphanothece hegewaldii]PSF35794.1 hypothetical protein C7H19_15325 [Aphanothece hegewaldii CCALA 016]